MDFAVTQSFDASASEVFEAYRTARFVERLPQIGPLSSGELLEVVDRDALTVVRIRFRFVAPLPSAATAVVDPKKLSWIEETTYDPASMRSATSFTPDHYGSKLKASARASFSDVGAGSTRTVTGAMKVKVPLVGGQVERVIASGLVDYLCEEATEIGRLLAHT